MGYQALLFVTEHAIARPEERRAIKREIDGAELLGQTSDGKRIHLFNASCDSILLREIGRLREITFALWVRGPVSVAISIPMIIIIATSFFGMLMNWKWWG